MVRNNVKVEINKEIAEIVDKYIAVVKENYDVVAIILFGSYAKGTEHKDSDIDIAVITDDIKTDTFDEEVKLMILRKGIDYRIEPHIITVADYENDETPFVVEVKNMCPTKFTSRFFRRNREVERGYIFDSPTKNKLMKQNKTK